MKSPKYEMEFEKWDAGTVDLTLEQEAAYLRVFHQILRYRGPVPDSIELLCQLWRCKSERAKELRSALIDAQKLDVADGSLSNRKALSILAGKPKKERRPRESALTGSDKFDTFWAKYPKRDGSNPKKPAQDKFNAAIKNGADPDAIISGAEKYRDELRAQGKEGTVYVAQAVTWINQCRWQDYGGQSGGARHSIDDRQRWTRMLELERERGHWPFEREPKSTIPAEFIAEWERENPANVVSIFDRKTA